MNNFTKSIAAITIAGLLFVSCKKGDNEKLGDTNDQVSSFMSTKQGSWWLYHGKSNTFSLREATGKDSMKMGLSYNYYTLTDTFLNTTIPEYFGKNNGMFIMLVDLDGSQTNYMNVVVCKENAKVGDTWQNTGDITYSGIKFDLLTEGEVIATGETITVAGKEYKDVATLKSKLKGKIHLTPTYVNCGDVTMWYAKDVGIIKSNFDISISSFYSNKYQDSLIDYHIAP